MRKKKMSDADVIQFHAQAIEGVITNAEDALDQIQDEGVRDECRAALKLVHDVADGAFRRVKRRCPEKTEGVELARSGGGK